MMFLPARDPYILRKYFSREGSDFGDRFIAKELFAIELVACIELFRRPNMFFPEPTKDRA